MTEERSQLDERNPNSQDDLAEGPDDTGRPKVSPDAEIHPGARNAPTIAPEERGEDVETEHAPGADL